MSANFDSEIIEANTIAELREKFEEVQRQRLWNYGHRGYTGTLGEKKNGLAVVGGIWTLSDAERDCRDYNKHPKQDPASAYNLGNGDWFVGGSCYSH